MLDVELSVFCHIRCKAKCKTRRLRVFNSVWPWILFGYIVKFDLVKIADNRGKRYIIS